MFLIKHSLHHQYSIWFFRFMRLRQYLNGDRMRRWAFELSAVLIVIIGLQFLYPSTYALPRTRISGEYLGFRPNQVVADKVNARNGAAVTVSTKSEIKTINLKELGITIDGLATAERASKYTWRERLIPLSIVFSKRHVPSYDFSVESQVAQTFATGLAKQNKTPVDAAVKINGITVEVVPAQEGYTYDGAHVQSQLETTSLNSRLEASIEPTMVVPAITTELAEQTAQQVRNRLATPLTIEAADEKITVDDQTLASWIVITPDPTKKAIAVTYDRSKIRSKLLTLSSKVYIAETPNRITMVDGDTVAGKNGSKGMALLLDASIDEVVAAAGANSTKALGKVQEVTPNTQIIRTYTRTSKGLQALVNYWVQTHGGSYGVSLRSISGDISASYNGNKQFTSASIYKLYLAYVVYTKVDTGSLSLGGVESCVDAMIVRSDNDCAVLLGNTVGWSANDGLLKTKGYSSTTLTTGAHLTTANDTALWLNQLAIGSLTSSNHNSSLLAMMKRQVYRSGIPAGARGSTVANKVGFLGSLNHDAAIVYSPKGTYVLSIMSSGSSFSSIADLANQIAAVMNQ